MRAGSFTPNKVTPQADGTLRIYLTQELSTVIDTEDYEIVRHNRWQGHKAFGMCYARGRIRGSKQGIFMHRMLLQVGPSMQVDHKDRDGLNNRRGNLRKATKEQNAWNHGKRVDNNSGTVGVIWHTKQHKWTATIQFKKNRMHLGSFDTKEAAVAARVAYEQTHADQFKGFLPINNHD